jgi:hypothetical protein
MSISGAQPASVKLGVETDVMTRRPWVIEKMLERIVCAGHLPGLYDWLLDFSMPLTAIVFSALSVTVLDGLDG